MIAGVQRHRSSGLHRGRCWLCGWVSAIDVDHDKTLALVRAHLIDEHDRDIGELIELDLDPTGPHAAAKGYG